MIEYDAYGRMKYNPELHFNQGKTWVDEDIDYLIHWLEIIGYEEMSLALGRTEATVRDKVFKLRKKGLMKEGDKSKRHRKLLGRCKDEQAVTY